MRRFAKVLLLLKLTVGDAAEVVLEGVMCTLGLAYRYIDADIYHCHLQLLGCEKADWILLQIVIVHVIIWMN